MSRSQPAGGGSIDLPTLLVTAVASAVAAYVTSKIWAEGTLGAAAFTPVLVALLKEMLIKPAVVVSRAVPVRGVVRSASQPGEPEGGPDTPESIEARIAQLGEAPGASRPGRRRAWQVAVITGLLGFLVAVVIITVPELIAGSSVAGGGRDTTFFSKKRSRTPATTTTPTTTTPTTTTGADGVAPADTVTVPPPAATVTVPPPARAPAPATPQPEQPPPVEPPPQAPATPAPPPAPSG